MKRTCSLCHASPSQYTSLLACGALLPASPALQAGPIVWPSTVDSSRAPSGAPASARLRHGLAVVQRGQHAPAAVAGQPLAQHRALRGALCAEAAHARPPQRRQHSRGRRALRMHKYKGVCGGPTGRTRRIPTPTHGGRPGPHTRRDAAAAHQVEPARPGGARGTPLRMPRGARGPRHPLSGGGDGGAGGGASASTPYFSRIVASSSASWP